MSYTQKGAKTGGSANDGIPASRCDEPSRERGHPLRRLRGGNLPEKTQRIGQESSARARHRSSGGPAFALSTKQANALRCRRSCGYACRGHLMKSTRVIVAALSLALLPASKAGAHAGDLDASFGQGGIAYYDSTFTGTCRRSAAAVGVQPGASIVLAGSEYDAGGREAVVVEKLDDIGRVIAGETTTFTGQDSQSRAL